MVYEVIAQWRPKNGGRLMAGVLALMASGCFILLVSLAHARDLPDLIIIDAKLATTGDCSGQSPLIAGKIYIKNIGQGRGQIFTTREMLSSFVEAKPQIKGVNRFVNSMAPGEMIIVNIELGKLQSNPYRIFGKHNVILEIDPRGIFKEEIETNNRIKVPVELGCN